jgi:hypothetical protein
VRLELESIEIPGEHEARERSWSVVESALREREPVERLRRMIRPVLVVAVVAVLLAAVLSPPGQAVLDEIRETVGIERAQPALFSLPTSGRLLVASDAGAWVVNEDGSKRLLGTYREASWSPFGRFVVAARTNELAALEPDGGVRWTLARPGVRSPRWAGTETDTRIAYVDRTGLRVVAGDGTGDRLLVAGYRGPIAWRPGDGFVLAYTQRPGRVTLYDVAARRVLERSAPGRVEAREPAGEVRLRAGASEVVVGRRVVFRTQGRLEGLTSSPDGRWLLVGWPAPSGRERLGAVPVEVIPACGRLVLRSVKPLAVASGSCSKPEAPYRMSRSGRIFGKSRGR